MLTASNGPVQDSQASQIIHTQTTGNDSEKQKRLDKIAKMILSWRYKERCLGVHSLQQGVLMKSFLNIKHMVGVAAVVSVATLMGCASVDKMTNSVTSTVRGDEKLSGSQEVPAVMTSASGTANINVTADGAVSGSLRTANINSTMAHIHMGAMGQNGAVIVPLIKSGDDLYTVPAGAKLTADQLAAYRAGQLYVNVHSAAHKGGEIRAQLKP